MPPPQFQLAFQDKLTTRNSNEKSSHCSHQITSKKLCIYFSRYFNLRPPSYLENCIFLYSQVPQTVAGWLSFWHLFDKFLITLMLPVAQQFKVELRIKRNIFFHGQNSLNCLTVTVKQTQPGPPSLFLTNHKISSEQKNWSSFISS